MIRERLFAITDYDRCGKQVALVDQPKLKGMGIEIENADKDIMLGSLFLKG